jgi:hypothetical protein
MLTTPVFRAASRAVLSPVHSGYRRLNKFSTLSPPGTRASVMLDAISVNYWRAAEILLYALK